MTETQGVVTGGVRVLLRLEGLAILVISVVLFARSGCPWWLFGALILAPDLSLLGYLGGPRLGAAVYNAAHTYVGPILVAVAGAGAGAENWNVVALIWLAHIGMDRAVGFGLKYTTGFSRSHLGEVGRRNR